MKKNLEGEIDGDNDFVSFDYREGLLQLFLFCSVFLLFFPLNFLHVEDSFQLYIYILDFNSIILIAMIQKLNFSLQF